MMYCRMLVVSVCPALTPSASFSTSWTFTSIFKNISALIPSVLACQPCYQEKGRQGQAQQIKMSLTSCIKRWWNHKIITECPISARLKKLSMGCAFYGTSLWIERQVRGYFLCPDWLTWVSHVTTAQRRIWRRAGINRCQLLILAKLSSN